LVGGPFKPIFGLSGIRLRLNFLWQQTLDSIEGREIGKAAEVSFTNF